MCFYKYILIVLVAMQTCAFSEVHDKVLLISIPKCGTNLIMKLMGELTHRKTYLTNDDNFLILHPRGHALTARPNYCVTHAIASKQNMEVVYNCDYRAIFIYRDPRDQVVSLAHYLKNLGSEWPHLIEFSIDQLIEEIIINIPIMKNNNLWSMSELNQFQGIDTFYNSFLDWMDHPLVYTTTFEKLIGVHGGGTLEEQLAEINGIAEHLGYELSQQEVLQISNALFGNSGTFRDGKIGSWKYHFTDRHKQLFKEVAGELLIKLGYETSNDW